MTAPAFLAALEYGCLYGIMALGVYLTFRVLDFPDLTVDGSLPLGAAVAAAAIAHGINPYAAILLACGAGFCAGACTALLHTRLGILGLLASILTMIALYSLNIRILDGPNRTLLGLPTFLNDVARLGLPLYLATPWIMAAGVLLVALLLVWFLHTEYGQAMLATGDNPSMIRALGVNTHNILVVGLGISNGLVALCGALIAQNQGSADVSMGVGTIIAGLASIILGETIFGASSVLRSCLAVIGGSILYRLAIGIALSLHLGPFSLAPSDLNLVTAIIVVATMASPKLRRRRM